MAIGDNIKLGVLRTRDLVELYLAGRMAVRTQYTPFIDLGTAPVKIASFNAARIAIEIVIANTALAHNAITVGPSLDFVANLWNPYQFASYGFAVITRDYQRDLDGVVEEVWAQANTINSTAVVRETILTPLPVDETP